MVGAIERSVHTVILHLLYWGALEAIYASIRCSEYTHQFLLSLLSPTLSDDNVIGPTDFLRSMGHSDVDENLRWLNCEDTRQRD